MQKLLLTALFFVLVLNSKSQIDSALAAQLQNVLNNKVATGGNHGVSAHLIMPNGQTWTGTAGLDGQNAAVTDSTVFHGASTTKLNIAVLALMLAEDSVFELDDSWRDYVTNLNVSFDTSITIRQLLNHSSGIKDYLETAQTPANVTANFSQFYTPQYILENFVSGTPQFAPGAGFHYSSSNYTLAALVIEAATGNTIQNELRTRVWNPLGMTHTYFGAYETYTEPVAGVWCNFGSGVTNYSAQPTTSMLSYGFGGANIVTCPTDLAKLVHALFTTQLLSSQSMTEMLTYVPQSFTGGNWTAGYGLGIHHQFGNSTDLALGHDGYYTNLSDVFYSNNCGFTLATMTNTETAWMQIFNPMYNIVKNYCNTTTSVNENDLSSQISVFPNPSNGEVRIHSSGLIDELVVIDLLGREVFHSNQPQNDPTIEIKSEGVYIVKVRKGTEVISSKLIISK